MSRYTFQLPVTASEEHPDPDGLVLEIAYGYDQMGIPGYFYQEFLKLDREVVNVLADLDTRWGSSRGEILEALEVFVEDGEGNGYVPRDHISSVGADLPF